MTKSVFLEMKKELMTVVNKEEDFITVIKLLNGSCFEEESIGGDKKIDDTMKVQIMNLKEYEQIKEYIPHKKNLLYSMNHVRYCKVDSFHDCVQGIMRVPDLKNHEMFVFGFCMYKQTLYFVEETNQIQLLMEHVKNDVYKNCRLHEVLLMILNYLIDDDVYRMQKIEEQLDMSRNIWMKEL